LHCHAQHSGAQRLKKQVVDKLHQKTLNEVIVCNAFDKEQNKFVSPRWLPPMHDCATGQKMGETSMVVPRAQHFGLDVDIQQGVVST
jgi:hypothetical protein